MTQYAQWMWNMDLDPRFSEYNRLHDSPHPGNNNKPLTGHSFSSILDFSSRLKVSGGISDASPLWVPYLIIKSRSSTVMNLSNQFLPFYSHCHHHISDLHYHNLFCHNTGFMLINPENAIRLIFIKRNSRHVTHLLKIFNSFLQCLQNKVYTSWFRIQSVPCIIIIAGSLVSSQVVGPFLTCVHLKWISSTCNRNLHIQSRIYPYRFYHDSYLPFSIPSII